MDHIVIHDTYYELDTFEVVDSHRKRMEVAFVDKLKIKIRQKKLVKLWAQSTLD